MKKVQQNGAELDEPLTKVLPHVRVSESVYQFLERRRVTERRRKLAEVIRLTLEDAAAREVKA